MEACKIQVQTSKVTQKHIRTNAKAIYKHIQEKELEPDTGLSRQRQLQLLMNGDKNESCSCI